MKNNAEHRKPHCRQICTVHNIYVKVRNVHNNTIHFLWIYTHREKGGRRMTFSMGT